jgi:hypothetical protein
MKTPAFLLGLLALSGPLAAPAPAQLVHVSFDVTGSILFRASSGLIPWNLEAAPVTKFDLYYDSNARIGVPLDGSRNFWRMQIESPTFGTLNVTRPFDAVTAGDNELEFVYDRTDDVFESMDLDLIFDGTIPTDGTIPFPLPPLGTSVTGVESGFFVDSGNSFYHIRDLAETSGGGGFLGYTARFVAVPESSSFAIGGLLAIAAGVITARRRKAKR